MSEFDPGNPGGPGDDPARIDGLQKMEGLAETLRDRPAGDWFRADLEEARALAESDPRYAELAAGLAAETLGARLDAINAFFEGIPAVELAGMTLPPNLSQLRFIYLSSRS
jgi:hypothetical protein